MEGRFSGLSDTVKGLLISAVPNPATDLAILGMRYDANEVAPGVTEVLAYGTAVLVEVDKG